MNFTDRVKISGVNRRKDGYLVADANIARIGLQTYLGSEVGRPDLSTVVVYRSPEEVFSDETMRSAAHRPVTNDHPPEAVTSANWKTYAVGNTSDETKVEGKYLRTPLMVSDEAAITDIENGKRELSSGYTCQLDWTAGQTPNGEAYDALQKNIRFNHVAIVKQGRAGPEVRIGDDAEAWGVAPINLADMEGSLMTQTLRTVMVDKLSVVTTDQGAQAIEKLVGDVDATRTALTDAQRVHVAAIAAKDEELGKLKAELQVAKDAAPKPADLDKLVADRAALVEQVRAVSKDIKVEGLTDADLRRAVVVSKLGADFAKDAADAEILGAFKAVIKDAKPADAFRSAVIDGGFKPTLVTNQDEMAAYLATVDDLNPKKGAA